jgi:hypothetical protein
VAVPYLQGSDFYITDAEKTDRSLNAEVWEHARRAQQRGLAPVVEIWARSSVLSRALDRLWRREASAVSETLSGIYLIRVNLATFGPESVVSLTPFALAGVPLFLGWNPVGQVLSAREFGSAELEDLLLPLSAFVEDVLHGRPHSLNPRPKLGNAKWDAALGEVRRSNRALQLPLAPVAYSSGGEAVGFNAAPIETPEVGAVPSEVGLNEAPLSARRPATQSELTTQREDAANEPVKQLQIQLQSVLLRARSKLSQFAQQQKLDLDYSVESLRRIDAYLDEHAAKEGQFLEQHGEQVAVLGIYLGDVVCQRGVADWKVDAKQARLSDALRLGVKDSEEECLPLRVAIELCADRSRSFYGQAVAWCSQSLG